MNTKQAEEQTGISRQNIRYYERQGLLEPARENGNAYRDYSDEDIERLKIIKMLRMLDMPLKEVESILKKEVPFKEAIEKQQENLLQQQRQLQAAIEVCASIHKEKSESIDVDSYLLKMENMSLNGSVFAKIVDDYKQVAIEEAGRQFSFYTNQAVNTAGTFEKALRKYAVENDMKFKMVKCGMYPVFTLDGITYTAARVLKTDGESNNRTRIVCIRERSQAIKKEMSQGRQDFLQGIHTVMMNIKRHRWKSFLNAVISLFIVLVMVLYLGNLNSAKQQLKELPENIPVSGQVMNMHGDKKSSIFISQQILEGVYQSKYTINIRESAELLGHFPGEEAEDLWFQGVNSPACIEGFEERKITWAKGWDWDRFLVSEDGCIMNKDFLETNGLDLQSEVYFLIDRFVQNISGVWLEREALEPVTLEVAGICDFSGLDIETRVPEVVLPLDEVKKIFEENDKKYFASSLAFDVKDSMELNALKKELKKAGLKSIIQNSPTSYMGVGLELKDNIFIQAAERLQKSSSLLQGFLPFVLLVVLMTGYIIPHLLLQGRREEYAIMRALGTSRKRCNILLFVEHILLAAGGGVLGAVIGFIIKAASPLNILLVWAAFLICYTLGAAVAMWMFGRFSVAAVLSRRD